MRTVADPSALVESLREIVRPIVAEQTAVPVMISQRNCELVGLLRRDFLELLRRDDCPLVVARAGKLRLVETSALLAWLRALGRGRRTPEKPADGADAVLAEMGLRPARGAR